MLSYYWPIGFVVFSNVLYHICSKSLSEGTSTYFSLLLAYCIAASICLFLYIFTGRADGLAADIRGIKWNSLLLGAAIVCLELGFIFMYKVGWNISIGSLVANITLAIVLVLVGIFFYKEILSLNKVIGIILCISGLIFINR